MFITLIFGMIIAWCLLYATRKILNLKIAQSKVAVFTIIFGTAIMAFSYIDNILKLVLTMVVFVGLAHFYLKIAYLKAALTGIIGFIFLSIGDILSALILINGIGYTQAYIKDNFLLQTTIYIVIVPVVMLLTYVFKKINGLFGATEEVSTQGSILSILYVFIVAVFIEVFSKLYESVPKGENNTYLIVFFCLTILFSGVNIWVILMNKRYLIQKNEYEQLKMYTDVVENLVGDIKRFRHDYANVVASLDGFLEMDDLEGLKEYYKKEVVRDGRKLLNNNILLLQNIKNPALKGLMSSKIVKAEYMDLKLSLDINGDIGNSVIRNIDLCKIAGILIDNGIEAAGASAQKFLNICIIEDGEYQILQVGNSYRDKPDISKMFLEGFSTKGEGRGLGLSNVKKILDANYKNILLNTYDENGIFKIELNIKKSKKMAA